jgi:photosystem II stability/assembly factor-like uncharacterized protein
MRNRQLFTLATAVGVLCTVGFVLPSGADAPGSPEEWHLIGPSPWVSDGLPENILYQQYAGRVTAVVGDPSDVKTIYLGAFGGGVWKTTDEGQTWVPLTDGAGALNIGCLALNRTTLYAGTVAATNGSAIGILKSTDGGATWTHVGSRIFERHSVLRIVTEPDRPEVVYAAVGELQTLGVAGGKGVWKSTDGGRRWTNVTMSSLPEGADVSFNDLAIDPTDPRRVYAAVSELKGATDLNGVWATFDSGGHWTRVLDPLALSPASSPQASSLFATKIALAPSRPPVLYAASGAAPNPFGMETGTLSVFRSTNHGQSWTVLPTPLGAGCPDDCRPLAGNAFTLTLGVDPLHPNIVYLADSKREGSFSISTDRGLTWTDRHIDPRGYTPHADHRAAGFDAAGNYLEGDDGGIARYHREEDYWEDFNNTLAITQFDSIQIHPTDPEIVYGGGIDSGLNWRNHDTLTWRQLPQHHALGDLATVRIDHQHPEIVFAQFTGCQACTMNVLQRSDDSGRHFQESSDGIKEVGGVAPFAIDPANTAHLFLGTSRLYESRDSAAHWRAIHTFDQQERVKSLAVAPGGDVIYAWVNGGLMASHDHGQSFQMGTLQPERQDPFTNIVVSPRDADTAYAAGAGLDHPNVYATHDGGLL